MTTRRKRAPVVAALEKRVAALEAQAKPAAKQGTQWVTVPVEMPADVLADLERAAKAHGKSVGLVASSVLCGWSWQRWALR